MPENLRRLRGGQVEEPTDERSLVERAKRGDAEAWQELVRKARPQVIAITRRLLYLECPDDVEDVAQEVFEHALGKIRTFRGQAAFTTWIVRITLNVARNHRGAHSAQGRRGVPIDEVAITEQPHSRELSADKRLEVRDLEKLVERRATSASRIGILSRCWWKA